MTNQPDLLRVLKKNSRTFFIPIVRLPGPLQQVVAAAYLCMRGIDEIEDHPSLNNQAKASILNGIKWALQARIAAEETAGDDLLEKIFLPYRKDLPEVTRRIRDWLNTIPQDIAPRVWDATIAMAGSMADWVGKNWWIQSEADLNSYTHGVAGSVGLLVCDILAWYDGTQINRSAAVQFGRGLQSVNILRNQEEDSNRGVNFFPPGWTRQQMFAYARRNLALARLGSEAVTNANFRALVDIPMALAEATLQALENGQAKLTRSQVMEIVGQEK